MLAQEVLPHLREVPIFVAGGLGRGDAILALLEMGAAGAQLGTRFAASAESVAHDRFKQAFVRANARDALPSIQLDELDIEHFWAGALRRAVVDGDIEGGSVMAGQSVGMVRAVQPVAAILDELVAQAVEALTSRAQLV